MSESGILDAAAIAVCSDRKKTYGEPEENFTKIANLWNAYLYEASGAVDPEILGPEDVAAMMILLKLARVIGSGYQDADSWVDIAGYAACGGAIGTRNQGE